MPETVDIEFRTVAGVEEGGEGEGGEGEWGARVWMTTFHDYSFPNDAITSFPNTCACDTYRGEQRGTARASKR